MNKHSLQLLTFAALLTWHSPVISQQSHADSVMKSVQTEKLNLDGGDKGVTLIKDQKFSEADQFFSNEINKNDLNREAYFNRGVARWELNDAGSACRDWSAVL